MGNLPFIEAGDVESKLSWTSLLDALVAGHQRKRANIGDLLLEHGSRTLLTRASWIDGMGIGLKSVTTFPDNPRANPPRPTVQGIFVLFDEDTGVPKAIIDGALVTRWKTAGDSVLGARFLANPESRRLLIVGAGTIARTLVSAYSAIFPGLEEIAIWNRNPERAEILAAEMSALGHPCAATGDLPAASGEADIIATATVAFEPLLSGDWVGPATHVDLIGAFTPSMREADDALITKSRIFVDARETALHDIGELGIPLAQGLISEADVQGDFYDLCNGTPGRLTTDEITLFKNGGGAHLDTMTGIEIFRMVNPS